MKAPDSEAAPSLARLPQGEVSGPDDLARRDPTTATTQQPVHDGQSQQCVQGQRTSATREREYRAPRLRCTRRPN